MKPTFLTLKSHHYSSEPSSAEYVSAQALYAEIGFDFDKLVNENSGYVNTCATRMSLALVKSKVNFHGRLHIKSGSYKGKTIEPGAKLLADQLALSSVFGKPSILPPKTAPAILVE
jgi:hypothetical protein